MKNKFLLLLYFTLLVWSGVGAQGIVFQKGTWAEIKTKAKAKISTHL